MFSRMSNTWADLFKASAASQIVEDSNPQCLHEISNEWICVDDKQNCEFVNDLEKHEFLTDEQKERRAQWQKRLQKGRSKNYNSMPSKARLRKNSSNSQKTDNQVQSNTTSNSVNSDENKVHLRAKLRLAVAAAGSQGEVGRTNDDDGSVSPSFSAHRFKPNGGGKSGKNKGARRMQQQIQQPCQRGMN